MFDDIIKQRPIIIDKEKKKDEMSKKVKKSLKKFLKTGKGDWVKTPLGVPKK